jgi:cytochrome c
VRLALLAFLVACSPANTEPAPAPVEKPISVEVDPAELQALAIQLAEGKELFAEHCASCHGDRGQGTEDGPRIVGKHTLPAEPRSGSKREVIFSTGADVYRFVASQMPADDPATLTPAQYNAVVAFALSANGVKLDKRFDGSVAQLIIVNP